MRSTVQSLTAQNPSIASASMALSSHWKGGLPVGGRPDGTWTVRAVSGSPLCRWVAKLIPPSISWMMPTTYQGTLVALLTWS